MRTMSARWDFPLKPGLATALATLVVLLVMSSCGGGGGDGGVGSGGTGTPVSGLGEGTFSSGTVTGFGSLVIDGITYDDTQIPVTVEAEANVPMPAPARLGHFVELEFKGASGHEAIHAIRIEAAAVGRIDAVNANGQVLNVLGQTIVENTSPDAGPVTFYSGAAGLHELRAGDNVEVHGVPRWNNHSGRYEILATRIERLQSSPRVQRLAGVVQSEIVAGTARSFRLGELQISYSPAGTLPAGVLPRNGDRVVVWSDRPLAAGTLAASAVRVVGRGLPAAGKNARLSGTVSRLDNVNQRFDLAGVDVRYAGAKVTPNGKGFSLDNGVYAVVDGAYSADGGLDAKHVKIRKRGASDYVEVELTGPIESFVDVNSFTVRGTPVDALGLSPLRGCGSSALRQGTSVRVEGRVQGRANGSVVKAETLQCLN